MKVKDKTRDAEYCKINTNFHFKLFPSKIDYFNKVICSFLYSIKQLSK